MNKKREKYRSLKIGLLCLCLGIFSQLSVYAEEVKIDKTDLDKGLIKVSVSIPETVKIKMMVQKDDKKYIYDLKSDGTSESFPLQLGNGDYKLTVLKNVSDTKYTQIGRAHV